MLGRTRSKEKFVAFVEKAAKMVVDTRTVRLVIFFGMFFYFATDYNTLVPSIFGKGQGKEVQNSSTLRGPEGPPRIGFAEAYEDIEFSDKEEEDDDETKKAKMMETIKNACLPKLICELTSSPYQDQLSDLELGLLNIIRDTTLTTMAEVVSRYHFAAHMGQLIAGIEGQGCHHFYPTCPLPRSMVLNIMKKIRLR